MVQMHGGVMAAGVAAARRQFEEGVVAGKPMHIERLEGVGAHAAAPIALDACRHCTVCSRRVLNCHVLYASRPYPDAIIARVFNVAIFEHKILNSAVDVQAISPFGGNDRINYKKVSTWG